MFEFKRNAEVGIWRTYPADPEVRVKIRPITKSVIRKLSAKATVTKNVREGGKTIQKEEIDNEIFEPLLLAHMVEDWEGFVVDDGSKLPPTPENVADVMDQYLQFATWINDEAAVLGETSDRKKKTEKQR
jgi:hypothetical protein